MSFLPENYEAPQSTSNFMHLQDGENRFRILSQPVIGWEDWQDKKPIRYAMENKPKAPIDAGKPIKHFWAMVVWNYKDEQIQVLHLTQASIRKAIENLAKDPEWREPYFYDIKIVKQGEGKETKYAINPSPHKSISPNIKKAFFEKKCNLQALFTNEDPFSKMHHEWVKGIFTEQDLPNTVQSTPKAPVEIVNRISKDQALALIEMVAECSPDFQDTARTFLTNLKLTSWYDLSKDAYDKIYPVILKKREETKQFDIFEVA